MPVVISSSGVLERSVPDAKLDCARERQFGRKERDSTILIASRVPSVRGNWKQEKIITATTTTKIGYSATATRRPDASSAVAQVGS